MDIQWMHRSMAVVVVLLVALAGCASEEAVEAPPAKTEAELAQAQPFSIVFDHSVLYEHDGAVLDTPIIEAKVNGKRTRLLVDTGASHHVLTREFADANELVYSEPIDPPFGRTSRIDAPVSEAAPVEIALGDEKWTVDDVLVIPSGPILTSYGPIDVDKLGVGGIISPQNLFDGPNTYVVLDFPNRRLIGLKGSETGLQAWLQSRYPDAITDRLERRQTMEGSLLHVPVTLDAQRRPVTVLLDSSGYESLFLASRLGALDREQSCLREDNHGKGCRLHGARVGKRTLEFGKLAIGPMDLVASAVVREEPGVDGVVRMDVLEHFTWVVPADPDAPILMVSPDQS